MYVYLKKDFLLSRTDHFNGLITFLNPLPVNHGKYADNLVYDLQLKMRLFILFNNFSY